MSKVKALVITGYGTNCEIEMAHACKLAGAEATIAHMSDIVSGRVRIPDYNFLNLPGGWTRRLLFHIRPIPKKRPPKGSARPNGWLGPCPKSRHLYCWIVSIDSPVFWP